jgi:hypothetical protein
MRSKIIMIAFAVLCSLTSQCQARGGFDQSKTTIFSGAHMFPGESRYSNGGYVLTLQLDGNLVLYNSNKRPIWATNTQGTPPRELVMQTDGNLVLYAADGRPVWASGTNNNPGAFAMVQFDGNLVIYRSGSRGEETGRDALWASNTSGR